MRNNFLRAVFFLLLISACIYFALSQKPQPSYQALLNEYADAQHYYDKATSLGSTDEYGASEDSLENAWNKMALNGFTALYHQTPAVPPVYDSLRFYTSFKIGELQHYFDNFSEAVHYYKEAIAIKQKSSLPDSLFFKPYLYAGIIFYNQNKFDTAVLFFKKAEAVQAAYNNKLAEGERLYNILGVLHYERGNYKQAQNYFHKALAVLPLSNPYYKELFVNYNINLAQMHLRLEEYDKANTIYQQLLPHKINLNEINHNIGSLNLSLGAAAKAITYFRKVSYQNNKIVRLYNSMGAAFFNLSKFDSATYYYEKAIDAYQSLGVNSDPVGYGLVLKNLGDQAVQFQKHPEAISYYQKAISQFYPSFTIEDIHANPKNFSGVFSYINLFNTLTAKAEAWHRLYVSNKDIGAAEEELNAYQSAFKLIEYVERTYDSDEARLFLGKIKHAVHGKPIDIAFELFTRTKNKDYINDLYYFDQQNKAASLSLNRQLNIALADITSPLLQREQYFKTEITRLSIRAAQVNDSTQLSGIHNSIRNYEIELGKIQEKAEHGIALKENNIPSISFLQNSLLDYKTALLSYHLAEEKLTTLVVTKKDVACYQTHISSTFIGEMEAYIQALKTPVTKLAAIQNQDYFKLFLPNLNWSQLKQLIVIPDDVLHYLPFETLRNNEGRYLVQDVAVQYQFSTALLSKNTTDLSGAQTLAFAPFAHQSFTGSLPQLQHSKQEIATTNGLQFFDTAATKTRFLQNSSKFQIVHLATHAVANNSADNLSYIAFSPTTAEKDNLLYAQEIYNLHLEKTGLIILSACETGAGQLVKGEGVISLSRAFAYAGCPNIITSLWKADDFSTAYLTTKIHQYLNEDLSITNAVQKAKTDYLNDKNINPRLKQPYYWAHLVFVGNYSPEKNIRWVWFLVAGAFVLLLLFLLLKKPGSSRQ